MKNRVSTIGVLISLFLIPSLSLSQDAYLSIGDINHDNNTVEIEIFNEVTIIGFQFQVQGLNLINGNYILDNEPVMLSVGPDGTVLAFGFEYFIYPGGGTLCVLEYAPGIDSDICIMNPVFTENGQEYLEVDTGICVFMDYSPYLILGDINQDELVNVLDIVQTVNLITGGIEPTPFEIYLLDFSNNDMVDVLDIISNVEIISGN